MAKFNEKEFAAAMAGASAYMRFLEPKIAALKAARSWEEVVEALGDVVDDASRAYVEERPDFASYVLSCWKRMIAGGGVKGWIDDGMVLVNPWGFDPGRVTVPVAIWHGELDQAVPLSHGKWLASHLPNAHPHLLPDEGHNLFMDHYGEVLDLLIASAP